MKKIIYIIDNLSIGGAQKHLIALASALKKKGYRPEIICLGDIEEDFIKLKAEFPIWILKMDCVWRAYFWRNLLGLISLLASRKPDIVHTYLNTANVFGVCAARLAHVPVAISSRRDLGHFRSSKIGALEQLTGRLSDKVVCVSEAVRNKVRQKEGLALEKTVVIYNGADVNTFKAIPPDRKKRYFNITMVATMDRKKKGHFCFLKAAEKILRIRKDVRFTLIGDGCLRAQLERHVCSRKLKPYFNFRGKCNDLHQQLRNTDLFVVCSETEGCSNALLEAMAMGIAPVATAVEGNLELIEDGISGCLVRPRDSLLMAQKILALLNLPAMRKTLAVGARKRILAGFTLNKMIKNYSQLYQDLFQTKNLHKKRASKIGYVVSLFPCWSEVFILNEIVELEKRGLDITIFSIRRELEGFIQEKAKPFLEKTKYIYLPGMILSLFFWCLRKPWVIFSLAKMVLRPKYATKQKLSKNIWCVFLGCYFAQIALRQNIEHIHAHFASYPALVALVMSRLTARPFTFIAHAHDIFLDKALLREKAKEAKAIVTISNYHKQYINDYCQNGLSAKIKVIHCGLDISEYMPGAKRDNKDENIIVSTGRLTKMKGFEYLIRSCKQLKQELAVKCYIVGEGLLRNDLLRLINVLDLNQDVFLTGVLDNNKIREILSKATIFVLPCVWDDVDGQDGLPLALIEAMALGIPVISSNISAIPELVEDGRTGLLVEPKNVRELSAKISELIKNRRLQEQLSLQGRSKIEREFNISKSADLLLSLFKTEWKKSGNRR